jgi:hypothetical protein
MTERAVLVPQAWSSALAFVPLAAAGLPGYLAVAFMLPSMPSWMEQPSAALDERLPLWIGVRALAPGVEGGLPGALIFWAVVLSLVSYALALRLARRFGGDPHAGALAAGVAAVLGITSVLALPNLDTDVYLYTLYARVLTVHGSNPYITVPASFPDDPFVPLVYATWTYVVSLYGPVWIAASVLVERLAGNDPLRAVFAFRLGLYGCGLATLAVIWQIAGRLNPTYRVAGLVAWGWNPIVVVYGPQKLDTFVTLLVLLGVWAWVMHRRPLSLVVLAAATLTKLVAAPLLVVCLLASGWRSSLRSLLLGLGVLVCVGTLAALPSSIYSPRLILFLPGFLGIVLVAGYLGTAPARLINGLMAVALYAATFLTPLNKPWYLLVLIGLLGVTAPGRVTSAGVVVCASALVVTLLPLQPGVDAETYQILWRLSTLVQIAALTWACAPLLPWSRGRGLPFLASRRFGRSEPVSESPV